VWAQSFRVPPADRPLPAGRVPTFSVVITAYQAARFISEAVESALGQTVRAHEVIVCDDGSTDDLETVLAPYRDEIVYLRKERGGTSSAINAAARAASGDFVAVLDADDAYLPERLEALGELASARPDLDILATDAYVEIDGRVVGRFNERVEFAVDDQRTAILERCFCAWPAYRRSRLLAAGGYDESLVIAHDWECPIRLIIGGSRAGLVDEPLYRYRMRPKSLTADRLASLRWRLKMFEKPELRHGLDPIELQVLARSVATQRRSLLLTEAEAAVRAGDPDARRRSLRVAVARGIGLRSRLAGAASAIVPSLARRVLERRARVLGVSRLGHSFARDEPRSR
jgi:glycosyltransferase involved in cell wall biosynthesis